MSIANVTVRVSILAQTLSIGFGSVVWELGRKLCMKPDTQTTSPIRTEMAIKLVLSEKKVSNYELIACASLAHVPFLVKVAWSARPSG